MNSHSIPWSCGKARLRETHRAMHALSRKDKMAGSDGTTLLAFTLRELETCWSWRVFDIGGQIVAAGQAPTKGAAREAVAAAYVANDAPVPTGDVRDLW